MRLLSKPGWFRSAAGVETEIPSITGDGAKEIREVRGGISGANIAEGPRRQSSCTWKRSLICGSVACRGGSQGNPRRVVIGGFSCWKNGRTSRRRKSRSELHAIRLSRSRRRRRPAVNLYTESAAGNRAAAVGSGLILTSDSHNYRKDREGRAGAWMSAWITDLSLAVGDDVDPKQSGEDHPQSDHAHHQGHADGVR